MWDVDVASFFNNCDVILIVIIGRFLKYELDSWTLMCFPVL